MATIPFSDSALATSDASGNITFTNFQQPRLGMWRTGSLSVVRSDGTPVVPGSVLPITWKAYVGSTIWGGWYNDQPSNLVQTNGPAVTVKGLNLAVSTAYQCIYTGFDSDAPPPLSPLPVPAPPPGSPLAVVTGPFTPPASATTTLGTVPVVVGTSVAVSATPSGGAMRLILTWTAPPIATILEQFTFDMIAGTVMNGLILPNVGPQLQVSVATDASVSHGLALEVFAGVPPITQKPVIPNGRLWSSAGNVPANTLITVDLAPYYGPVSFTMFPNNTTGFGIYIIPSDYLGNQSARVEPTQGWPAGTGPFISQGDLYLPAMHNQLIIDNSAVGAPTGYGTSGITLGP